MKINLKKTFAALGLFIFCAAFAVTNVQAQLTTPTVRVVLPERFRVLTNQFFDLRVEAENLVRTTARVQIIINNENGTTETLNFGGAFEQTNNNDNNAR